MGIFGKRKPGPIEAAGKELPQMQGPPLRLYWSDWADGAVCTECDHKVVYAQQAGFCCPECGAPMRRATVRYQYEADRFGYRYGSPWMQGLGPTVNGWEVKPAVRPAGESVVGGFICAHCGAPNP